MSQAKDGDAVTVHYTGKLEDGTVFDSSVEREPLEFCIGKGEVIPGFEQGAIGMAVGESKSVTIPPDKAYGAPREDLVITAERNQIPENIKPEVGLQLQMQDDSGNDINVTITKLDDEKVTLDANHPLAGKTLVFDIELVKIG